MCVCVCEVSSPGVFEPLVGEEGERVLQTREEEEIEEIAKPKPPQVN